MKNNFIKFLTIFVLLFYVLEISAENLDLISDKYILYNLDNDDILLEHNSNIKTQVASLTKIMTVIVAIENIDNFDEKVTVTNEMIKDIEWDVAKIGLKSGQQVTYNDLLYCSILPSAADCVNALAISISGNYDAYIKLMNNKVKELGLKNTNFANVVGLYDKNNFSSAYDIAEILKYSLKNEKFKKVFETKEYTLTTGKKVVSTLIGYNKKTGLDVSYIKGSKTGYIKKAGNCLATTAMINDTNLLLVTLNAHSSKSSPHILDATQTYKYIEKNYSYIPILVPSDVITTLKTKYAKEKEINIYQDSTYEYFLNSDFDRNELEYDYNGTNEVSYFTKKGKKIGTLKIKNNNKILKEIDVIYNEKLTFSLLSFLWVNKLNLFITFLIICILIKAILHAKKNK